MRDVCKFAVFVALFAASLPGAVINFSTATVGTTGGGDTIFRYTYDLTGVVFQANQELDIRFSATVYKSVFNGVAPSGGLYDLLVFPVDSPPGATGDYSLLALVNNPSTAGPFTVDFTLKPGQAAGSQQFFINQLAANGSFLSQVEAGNTSATGNQNTVPEPTTLSMAAAGLIGAWLAGARRWRS
jgi:PEP-CTERM motif